MFPWISVYTFGYKRMFMVTFMVGTAGPHRGAGKNTGPTVRQWWFVHHYVGIS